MKNRTIIMKKMLFSLMILGASAFGLNAQIQGYSVGQTVTDFTVTDTDGNTHTLSDYTNAGKWVVLDFFFVDCPPCNQIAPLMPALYEKYCAGGKDVEFFRYAKRFLNSNGHFNDA